MTVTLREMTSADHQLVDDILADAFADNPLTRLLFASRDPGPGLKRLNRTSVRHKKVAGIIAEVDGVPAAAMLVNDSPNCEPDGMQGLVFLVDAIRALRWRIFRAVLMLRGTTKNHPKWQHRHLTVLGVRREFHGQGVGSTLLQRFCEQVDAAGKNAYLETDSEGAKRLYERFGFKEVNRTDIEGLSFIYMWRIARSD